MKSVRQPDDVQQSDVPFAPLDAANVVSMQAGQLRKVLLRQTAVRPQFANSLAK